MDRLAIPPAINGLLATAASAIDFLYDLNISPLAATAALNHTLRELKECRSSIYALHKTLALLESRQVPFPERAGWITVDEVVATLTDNILALSRLFALACTISEAADLATAITSATTEELCRRYEKRLKALCARIRWHNLSIAMMMTIVNCPAEKDAKRSRAELSRRISRLLTSNVSLAARMRGDTRPFCSSASASPEPEITVVAPVSAPQPSVSTHFYRTQPSASTIVHPNSKTMNSSGSPPPHHHHPAASATNTASSATPSVLTAASSSSSSFLSVSESAFSGVTLADVSVLDAITLPVSPGELRGDGSYYLIFDSSSYNSQMRTLPAMPSAVPPALMSRAMA